MDDVIGSMLLVAQKAPLNGEVYNIATGHSISIRRLAKTICDISQLSPNIQYTNTARPGDPDRWVVDVSRIRSLGFNPAVSLEEGLARTLAWFWSADD